MSAAELAAAREVAASMELPTTPVDATMDDGGGLSPAAGNAAPVPSIADLLQYLGQQNVRIENMMALMQHDRQSNPKSHLSNVRLEEKYFRNVSTFNNQRSSWKEWRRQFLNAVREGDVYFADFVETFDNREEPIDHILSYNPGQHQLSTNMYNRLVAYTIGAAFQIVEGVPH